MFPAHNDLAELSAAGGPVASVYLRLSVDGGEAGRQDLLLRWRALRTQLQSQGANEPQLKTLDERVTELAHGNRVLAAFTADGQLRLSTELTDCDIADLAWFGALAHVLPMLQWRQTRVPYVLTLIDRTGGVVSSADGSAHPVRTEVVTGPDDEIERNAPGGWAGLAQGRYQRRAEDSWAHNAAAVATHLVRMIDEVNARLVILAGDVRAVQLLEEHLPDRVRALVRLVTADGDQRAPGPAQVDPATVRRMVNEAAGRSVLDVVHRFADGLGASGRSVQGLAGTIEALQTAAVDTLLIADQPTLDRSVWIGPQPTDLWTRPDERPTPEEPQSVPLVDAVCRAAIGTGAEVLVVSKHQCDLADGVGAMLRY